MYSKFNMIFDIVSGHYMSNVKFYGMWLVERKHRVRGSWKRGKQK